MVEKSHASYPFCWHVEIHSPLLMTFGVCGCVLIDISGLLTAHGVPASSIHLPQGRLRRPRAPPMIHCARSRGKPAKKPVTKQK